MATRTRARPPRVGAGDERPTLAAIGLAQFAPYLVNSLAARWNGRILEDLRPLRLTTAKMRALAVLSLHDGLTVGEVALLAVTEQPTMSRTLAALERQGLVRREAPEEDGRTRIVRVTEAGRAAFARFWPTMHGRFQAMFAGIDPDEYDAFVSTLHKVLANCEAGFPVLGVTPGDAPSAPVPLGSRSVAPATSTPARTVRSANVGTAGTPRRARG